MKLKVLMVLLLIDAWVLAANIRKRTALLEDDSSGPDPEIRQ